MMGTVNPGIPANLPKIRLMELAEAPPSTRVLLDLAKKYQVLNVASDFRALALFHQFLSIGWSHVKPYVGPPDYTLIHQHL